ncbi:MAG: hypothetical protein DLM68_03635 [Hyphomicrobiales bacterium]|nr:MAG: hypothetical protein DLM68_03635 [Hyphomicrobiales bacterium]
MVGIVALSSAQDTDTVNRYRIRYRICSLYGVSDMKKEQPIGDTDCSSPFIRKCCVLLILGFLEKGFDLKPAPRNS